MGDYSRDTFRLTNAVHLLLDGEAVDDPRHYVGVRMQQGVPLLDSDWNEADDMRRRELELLLRDVIGDGVPGTGEGFAVAPVEADDDFAVLPGFLVTGGWPVINSAIVRYSELPEAPALTTPAGNRTDLVYLDAWEAEVEGSGERADERLVNESIGIETAARVERRWTVRVAENTSSFDELTLDEPGHRYYPLARFFRTSSARIQPFMIENLRRLGLTLADGIKSPMFLHRGTEVVEPERFSEMLAGLRSGLRFWQENGLFPITLGSIEVLFAYQNALHEIYNLTSSAEVASDARSLDNGDGLSLLQKLVDAQRGLLDTLRRFGTGVPADQEVIDFYEAHLDGDEGRNLDGIQPALDTADLLGAVLGQETLNLMLGLSTGELPAGSVSVTLDRVDPPSPIAAGAAFEITFAVNSQLLSPETPEVFDLEAVVSDVRWGSSLDRSQVTLDPGAVTEVVMRVTPSASLAEGESADVNLVARAHRRPSLRSVQPAQRFTVGQPPPGETFFFYSGTRELQAGVLPITRSEIEEEIFEIDFTLLNTTGGDQSHEFRVEHELVFPAEPPAGVDPNAWIPNAPVVREGQAVPGASRPIIVPLRAPDLSGVSQDIEATVVVTATLTGVNGAPVGDGKSSTIELPIRIAITG